MLDVMLLVETLGVDGYGVESTAFEKKAGSGAKPLSQTVSVPSHDIHNSRLPL
jgi:hypothetical protein